MGCTGIETLRHFELTVGILAFLMALFQVVMPHDLTVNCFENTFHADEYPLNLGNQHLAQGSDFLKISSGRVGSFFFGNFGDFRTRFDFINNVFFRTNIFLYYIQKLFFAFICTLSCFVFLISETKSTG